MIFVEQKIQGVYLLHAEPFEDERGMLRRNFCQNELQKYGLMSQIRQTNISENHKARTLRGFHYQNAPHQEAKLLTCMRGSIYDIVVDLRPQSKTYLQWLHFELSADSRISLYIPEGCANAWMTLQDDSWIFYYHSEFYTPGVEGGIRYNDPLFRFQWPFSPDVISKKDLSYPDFQPEGKVP